MQHQSRRFGASGRLVLLLAALLALAGLPASPLHATQPQPASSSPDLFIQSLALDPPNPLPGQLVNVNVVVKNVGDVGVPADDANRFGVFLYVDPQQQPPVATTPETNFTVWNLGLAPNASFTYSYENYIFPTAGCNHLLYAWVDRANRVAESNESNNLASVNMCVGTSGDLFEPDDGCTLARDITSVGTVYAIQTSRLADDADTELRLYDTDTTTLLASNDDYS